MCQERRGFERVPILGSLPAEVTLHAPMTVLDISQGGVTVETTFSLRLGSLHDLKVSLDGRSLVLQGRVTHSSITDVDHDVVTYRTGLEFVELPEAAHRAIAAYLDALTSTRAGG
jgi:hypothetical protein